MRNWAEERCRLSSCSTSFSSCSTFVTSWSACQQGIIIAHHLFSGPDYRLITARVQPPPVKGKYNAALAQQMHSVDFSTDILINPFFGFSLHQDCAAGRLPWNIDISKTKNKNNIVNFCVLFFVLQPPRWDSLNVTQLIRWNDRPFFSRPLEAVGANEIFATRATPLAAAPLGPHG